MHVLYSEANRHVNLHKRVSCGYSGWYSGSSVYGGIVLLFAMVGFTITTAGSLLPTELKAKTCLGTKNGMISYFQKPLF